jgi:integrase
MPALRGAGVEVRGPYAMRHTFATWAIEQNVVLPHLATIMGTSVRELEGHLHRWLTRTDDQLRAIFDTYDQKWMTASTLG